MVTVGVLARLEAKPGMEEEVARFLEGALPLAQQEEATTAWFAIRLGPSTFGIFDVFPDEPGREAHLAGPIAAALIQRADELLTEPPMIVIVEVLAFIFRESADSASRGGPPCSSATASKAPPTRAVGNATGALYRFDPDRRITRMHDEVRCSNATRDRPNRVSSLESRRHEPCVIPQRGPFNCDDVSAIADQCE